jgi:hypothetical protein
LGICGILNCGGVTTNFAKHPSLLSFPTSADFHCQARCLLCKIAVERGKERANGDGLLNTSRRSVHHELI